MLRLSHLLVLLITAVPSAYLGAAEKIYSREQMLVAGSNNQFALALYAQLRKQPGNLFLSPFSISTALGMTSVGAREDTLKQMMTTLHLPEGDAAHKGFADLIRQFNDDRSGKRPYQLSVANALWGQQGSRWEAPFLERTRRHYGAGLREVDFVKDTEGARKTINAWVEKETKDKIKELIKPGVLDPMTRLVLTNAIYFKGDWQKQFDKKRTFVGMFRLTEKDSVKTLMMYQQNAFGFAENRDVQLLEMPYSGKELTMVVILPRKVDGLSAVEGMLNHDQLQQWAKAIRSTNDVEVYLPKFKLETEFFLGSNLEAMGMKDVFHAGKADLSGMNGAKDLYISAVVHKAFVDVNEEGTEAAAATGVVVSAASARQDPRFVADHPFLFLIKDQQTGTILFIGRLTNPKS